MPNRARLAAAVAFLALLAAAGLGMRALSAPSAAGRYESIQGGMTLAEAKTAVGDDGTADPGDTTGRYLSTRSEQFAEPAASVTSTHYWVFPDGMVVAEFSDGRVVRKTYLRGA